MTWNAVKKRRRRTLDRRGERMNEYSRGYREGPIQEDHLNAR